MRKISLGIGAVVLAVSALFAVMSPAGADAECDPLGDVLCFPTTEFAQLRADIDNPAYTSPVVRKALHALTSNIERLYPTDPLIPNDPVQPGDPYRRLDAVLQAALSAIGGFARAGMVTSAGLSVLQADIDALLPPNPI